jgi:hypothetical protein
VLFNNNASLHEYNLDSSPVNSDHQSSSRYGGGGLRYSNQSYDPIKSRLVESPLNNNPTVDNQSNHNRQQHFISTTNLSVPDTYTRRQQQNPLNHSTPYLSHIRDDESSTLKNFSQEQQTDRHSIVGSDSGIVMVNSNHQHQPTDDNKLIEKKLTDLVQKLGRQLESDTQKISEKLELKMKNLENMINQQTYVIRRQDEVIERLKTKILKIETERDHFRDRLSIHERRESDEKNHLLKTETDELTTGKNKL